MLNLLILIGVLLVGVYTLLFGIQNLKERNYLGFWAVMFLTAVVVSLPLYLIFFKKF